MFICKSKIDRLSVQRKKLIVKRENSQRRMRERNEKRESKIHLLENAAAEDYVDTMNKVKRLNRKIDKIMRDIKSETTYVNEVASDEIKDQEQDSKKDKESKSKLKAGANNE